MVIFLSTKEFKIKRYYNIKTHEQILAQDLPREVLEPIMFLMFEYVGLDLSIANRYFIQYGYVGHNIGDALRFRKYIQVSTPSAASPLRDCYCAFMRFSSLNQPSTYLLSRCYSFMESTGRIDEFDELMRSTGHVPVLGSF